MSFRQLQDELDELQRQLDMRQGNYGNSLSSVQMIAEVFKKFVDAADSVEVRVREFMGTADRMMKDPQLDSRRIRHEVDETERRWKTFYNSIRSYGAALADSAKFFEDWQAVRTVDIIIPPVFIVSHVLAFSALCHNDSICVTGIFCTVLSVFSKLLRGGRSVPKICS